MADVTEATTETTIKQWLKYASDREGGRKQRALAQKSKNTFKLYLIFSSFTFH